MGTNTPRKPPQTSDQPQPRRKRQFDIAFSTWLERGLHQLYDHVAYEPIPDALLKVIEAHRNK